MPRTARVFRVFCRDERIMSSNQSQSGSRQPVSPAPQQQGAQTGSGQQQQGSTRFTDWASI